MNNEEKNTFVKRQIIQATLELLRQRSIDDISICEITSAANVGRVSFYRNYTSKRDIIQKESDRLINEWGTLFADLPSGEYNVFFLSIFDFFKNHEAFYTTLRKAGLSSIIMDTIVGMADTSNCRTNLDAYLRSFWAYGVYGWLVEWIDRGMQETSEELVMQFEAAQAKQKTMNSL